MDNELSGKDAHKVTAKARDLSMEAGHGFINIDHLVGGMLGSGCLASALLSAFDESSWRLHLKTFYLAGTVHHSPDDTVPLTVEAERAIYHACQIAALANRTEFNSVDLLLSIMSYENFVREALHKAGIHAMDIAGTSYPSSIQGFTPTVDMVRKKPVGKLGRLFLTSKGLSKLRLELLNNLESLFLYGQYDDSRKAAAIALELPGDPIPFLSYTAVAYIRERNFSKALPWAIRLVASNPEGINSLITLARIYDELEQYVDAEAILNDLASSHPSNELIQNNRGFNLLLQERYEEAVPYFEKAIALQPEWAYLWDNLGYTKYKLGHVEEGLESIERSIALDKGNSFAYKCKGITQFERGQKEAAMHSFQLALKWGYTRKYGTEVEELVAKIKQPL